MPRRCPASSPTEACARRHSSAACRKSVAEIRSGHSGGSTTRSTWSAYSATSVMSRRWTSRLRAWTATASGRVGGAGERAGVPGRQHVDPVGAQGDRLRDGRVVGQSAVDERAAVAPHRRQHGRDGAAGQDRADRVAVGEQDLLARQQVGGDQVHRDRRVLQAGEVTCRRTRRSSPEPVHRASRAPARASIICGARSGKTSSRRSAAHVAASRSSDARRRSVRRDEDGVERAGGRAHEQVGRDALARPAPAACRPGRPRGCRRRTGRRRSSSACPACRVPCLLGVGGAGVLPSGSLRRPGTSASPGPWRSRRWSWSTGALGVGRRAEGDEQRREVLDRRVGVRHARAPRCGSRPARRRRRGPAPRRPRRRSPPTSPGRRLPGQSGRVEERQAVGHEAGADDEHALLAQGPQPRAQGEQPVGVVGGHAQLQHRDVGLGVHDLQRHPGAVVEAAAAVLVHRLGVGQQRRRPGAASSVASGVS